ncbi:Fic family protein [Singulisphaera rosea]
MHEDLKGTPYLLPSDGARAIQDVIADLSLRVQLLRAEGTLTDMTLREYYGETRFDQIAESNALEGSTLSVGETELAVLKGITISGHDPGFSKDAQALASALDELAEMARLQTPTNLEQLRQLHELILSGRIAAGTFRRSEVRNRGSKHIPPRTWHEIMNQMEDWESWSKDHPDAPPLLRASVLHAWLEHIHPFDDGNGRTGRAITNLELVRAGYPPIIIRRKDRDQYLDALGRADDGDLGAFLEIVAGRLEDALRDLERAAQRKQGYDLSKQKYRRVQSNRLAVWNASIQLMLANVEAKLADQFMDSAASVEIKASDQLNVDDFIDLCEGHPVRPSRAFRIRVRVPEMPAVERLACASVLGGDLLARLSPEPVQPVLKWSIPNPDGYPPWTAAETKSPGGEEMTIRRDRWLVVRNGIISEESPTELAAKIAADIAEGTVPDSSP